MRTLTLIIIIVAIFITSPLAMACPTEGSPVSFQENTMVPMAMVGAQTASTNAFQQIAMPQTNNALNFFTNTNVPKEPIFHSVAGMVNEKVEITHQTLMNPTTYTVRFADGRFAIFTEKYTGTMQYKSDSGVTAIIPSEISFGSEVLPGHGYEFMIDQNNNLDYINEVRPSIRGYGDITNDGVVTNADMTVVYKLAVNQEPVDSSNPGGDVNGNGKYDFNDVDQIYRYMYDLNPCFSVNMPIVNAGTDKKVMSGQAIILDDANAYEQDGSPLNLYWGVTGGSLSSYNSQNPIFYAPNVSEDTVISGLFVAFNERGGATNGALKITVVAPN
jgi:hypothetical protein